MTLENKAEFKNMCDSLKIPYVEFKMGLIIANDDGKINIRQYDSEGACLSSWVSKEEFKEKISKLIE